MDLVISGENGSPFDRKYSQARQQQRSQTWGFESFNKRLPIWPYKEQKVVGFRSKQNSPRICCICAGVRRDFVRLEAVCIPLSRYSISFEGDLPI